jgi:hypothetical protein
VAGSQFYWDGHWNSTPYDFDAKRLPNSLQLAIADATVVQQWGIVDGSVVTVPRNADGTWQVSLAQAPAALLFIPDDASANGAQPHQPTLIGQVDLAGRWQAQIVATVDNQWGDLARPATGLMLPHTMRFGDATGQVLTQGFGTYAGRQRQPVHALPPPLTVVGDGDDPITGA